MQVPQSRWKMLQEICHGIISTVANANDTVTLVEDASGNMPWHYAHDEKVIEILRKAGGARTLAELFSTP